MRAPIAAALLLLLLLAPPAHGGALHTDGRFFRDAGGGAVILRGVDVAGNAKVPPFTPISDGALLDPLPRWGLDVVRLLFTWEAYEPQPGAYDANYLAYYRRAVTEAAARGLYVVVDFHQDGFSRFDLGGCGEGFPAWTLPPTVPPATPDNGTACADWGSRMLGDKVLPQIWSAFYADGNGARTRYLSMIARVAAALADLPMVVGYDLLNEPGGDERRELAPFYEDAVRALRAVDPSAIVFVSPGYLTSGGVATQLARPSFDNLAYAPHYYDPSLFLFHGWQGDDGSGAFGEMNGTAAAWNVPLFVGELGASPSTDMVGGYLDMLYRQLDVALASGAQWVYTPGWTPGAKDGWNGEDFSIVDDTGALRANFQPRPYARRVAGTPQSLGVSAEPIRARNALQLTWHHDPAAGQTELFAPAAWFGGSLAISADGDVTCSRDGDLVRCQAPTAGDKRVRLAAPARRCGLTGGEAVLLLALLARWRRRAARARATG